MSILEFIRYEEEKAFMWLGDGEHMVSDHLHHEINKLPVSSLNSCLQAIVFL